MRERNPSQQTSAYFDYPMGEATSARGAKSDEVPMFWLASTPS